MNGTFSIREALSAGWRGTWRHVGFWLGALVILMVLSGLAQLIEDTALRQFFVLTLIVSLAAAVVEVIMSLGLLKAALAIIRGDRPRFAMLFNSWSVFLKYVGAYILYSLIVLGGLLLLIIPGVLWGMRYQFYMFAVVDRRLGPRAAISFSGNIARGAELKLFGFAILTVLINLLGLMAVFIGIFITMPLTILALAHIYTQLVRNREAVSASAPLTQGA